MRGGAETGRMDSALDEIEFLVLSENRVDVLRRLADRPHTRRELAAGTGASQPTLGRILGDLQDRQWIVREGSEYSATATGRLVAGGFGDLLDVMETEERLRPIVRWLPADALGFDLRHLTEATITVPSQVRPSAPVQRDLDLLRSADEVRVFSYAFNEQSLELIRDRTSAGDQRFRGVFASSAIEELTADSLLRRRLESLLTADDAEIRTTDEEIPVAVTVADDRVLLFLRDESGVLRASLDADADAIRAWADESFERHWEAATPLDAGTL